MGDVVTWWDIWGQKDMSGIWGRDKEILGVMEGTGVGMMWRGIGDMEEGCGKHQDMGRYEDILVWSHHPGETLGTCRGHGNTLFVSLGTLTAGTPQMEGQGGDILGISWAWRLGGHPPGDIQKVDPMTPWGHGDNSLGTI